jgi:putative oxidoreductase
MQKLFTDFILPPGAAGILILRVITGLAFMLHGFGKIQQPFSWMGPDSWAPPILQAIAAVAEFGGGLALILGLFTPLACFGLVCVMTTAILSVHLPKGHTFVSSPGSGGSFELPLIYFAIALALMMIGPGVYSLDALLFKRKAVTRRDTQSIVSV